MIKKRWREAIKEERERGLGIYDIRLKYEEAWVRGPD